MSSILKVDQIQNTDGQSALVIASDGSVNGVKYAEAASPSGRTITSTTMSSFEQGTWTPSIEIGSASTGITYASRSADYVRIGNLVFVNGDIALSSKGSITGSVQIAGLPFTVYDRTGATSNDGGAGLCAYQFGTTGVYSPIGLLGVGGTKKINMYAATSSGGNISAGIGTSNITNGFSIRWSLTYITDD